MLKPPRYSKELIWDFVLFLLPISVPIVILGGLISMITQSYILDYANTRSSNALRQMSSNIESVVAEADAFSLSLSYNTQLINELLPVFEIDRMSYQHLTALENAKGLLDAAVNTRSHVDSIYIYLDNDYGRFINSQNMLSDLSFAGDTSWYESYRANAETNDCWLECRTGNKGKQLLSVYCNIYLLGIKNIGVVVYNISLEYLQELMWLSDLYPGQTLSIFDIGGRHILSYPAMSASAVPPVPTQKLNPLSHSNEPLVFELKSEKYGLVYYAVTPPKIVYELPCKIMKTTGILVLASFLIAAVLLMYIRKRQLHLVNNVHRILDAAASGNPLPEISASGREQDNLLENLLNTFLSNHYYQVKLQERQHQIDLLEMKALYTQLNPHFLMNTLDTVYWKSIALTNGPNEVNDMIENLSEILKYALENASSLVPLRKEFFYVENYLDIQKMRYGDHFGWTWDYEENCEEILVPKLLLQPLVENAIYHGIKKCDRKCSIHIRTTFHNGVLRIMVADTGCGISPQHLQILRGSLEKYSEIPEQQSEHIGLINTQKRLRLLYGEKASLLLHSKENKVTVVTVQISF